MATRVVEGKKPYTGGKAIEIDENKVISLRLRDENNLIIYDEGDDEIYVDLQLKDGIRPTDAFPVGITTGRVLVADDWDITGTLICAKTTSGDNIKLLYGDDGTLWIDNGTGTFKQIYFKSDVDQLLQELRTYVNQQLALKQDKLIAGDNINIDPTTNTISADVPPLSRFLSLWDCATGLPLSFPASVPFDYVTGDHYLVETVGTTNYRPSGSQYTGVASTTVETDPDIAIGDSYIYDGTVWLLQKNSGGGGGGTVVSFSNIVGNPTDNTALANALNAKANATDVNTKTFYLSGTGSSATVLAEAQAAYDWYVAGKNPIIMYNNVAYILSSISTGLAYFKSSNTTTTATSSTSNINQFMIAFTINSGDVTEVTSTSSGMVTNILKTNVNYTTPYTPLYNGSPATKKYVDDSIYQKRQFHVFDYDNITSSDVEAILGILADNEKGIAFVTESIGALVSSVPTMIYITSWNYSGTELYLYGFSFDNGDSPEVTTYSFIIDSTDYSITYDESLAYSLVGRTADSGKVLTGTGSGFVWEEPTFKVYNVDDVHNPSVSAGTLSNIVNKLKTDGKTAILYDAPNEYMYYPTELSISTLSGDIYWTTIHDSSVTIVHRPVSRASATSNRTLGTVTESDKYLSPNPIQVVSALPATPDANTIYIVQ